MLSALLLGAGLAAFRLVLVRPADEVRPRALWRMDGILLGLIVLALIATPLYVAHETALFGDRSLLDVGWIAENLPQHGVRPRLHRPGRPDRRLRGADGASRCARQPLGRASLAVAVGAGALLVPGLVGHPGPGSVPALAVPLDWLHLCAAATWAGGLLGLALVGRDAATRIAPRFSTLALLSVIALGWTGVIAALENVKSIVEPDRHRLRPVADREVGAARGHDAVRVRNLRSSRAGLKLRLPFVRSELSLVTVIIVAAAVLTTLPPPGRGATTQVAAAGDAPIAVQTGHGAPADPDAPVEPGEPTPPPTLDVGPGPIDSAQQSAPPYLGLFSLDPNGAGRPNDVKCSCRASDEPISGAKVTATFRHVEIGSQMPVQTILLPQTAVGVYAGEDRRDR